MALLTTEAIRGFVTALTSGSAAQVDALGVAADSQLAAFSGRPAAAVGVRATFEVTTYKHRTHTGECKLYQHPFGVLELPVGPVVAVISVANDGVVLVEGTDFELDGQARTLTLLSSSSARWALGFGAVAVEYEAGFDTEDLPGRATGLYQVVGAFCKHLYDRPGRQDKTSVAMGGASASFREETVPDALIAELDAMGLLLPRAKRRLALSRHRAGVPQPTTDGGGR